MLPIPGCYPKRGEVCKGKRGAVYLRRSRKPLQNEGQGPFVAQYTGIMCTMKLDSEERPYDVAPFESLDGTEIPDGLGSRRIKINITNPKDQPADATFIFIHVMSENKSYIGSRVLRDIEASRQQGVLVPLAASKNEEPIVVTQAEYTLRGEELLPDATTLQKKIHAALVEEGLNRPESNWSNLKNPILK
jgi:hypothetical protein